MDKATARWGDWLILDERGAAGDLHAGAADRLQQDRVVRTLRFATPERAALVLGSHQSAEEFDPSALAAAGVELARRRTGGSAVLVGATRVLWVDVLIPADDPLWSDDVGRAAWWVGELWADAIGGGRVWRGAMQANEWSPVVCFAGLGPGEVTVDGRKVVGVCQRRTRQGVLFQTAALLTWRPDDYVTLLRRAPGDPGRLEEAAQGLGVGAEDRLRRALRDQLVI